MTDKPIRRLPDSELDVMQALWECRVPADRSEIAAKLRMATQKEPAQTTLLTLLGRLQEKGFVRIEKRGRGSVYTPLVSRDDYRSAQSRTFVDRLFGGSMQAFASALADGGLTPDELDELRAFLEEAK